MDVSLQSPTLLILGRHDPGPRDPQLLQPQEQFFGQADVPKDDARSGGKVPRQVLLGGGEPFAWRLGQGERAEKLSPVVDREGEGGREVGELRTRHREACRGKVVHGEGSLGG